MAKKDLTIGEQIKLLNDEYNYPHSFVGEIADELLK